MRTDGYSVLSIATHWISAGIVLLLFFTHEDRVGTGYWIHVSLGAVLGVFLLWRVWHRVRRGLTDKPEQPILLNLLSRVVLIGMLIAIVLVTLTGYLLPWTVGEAIDVAGLFEIPSPMMRDGDLHGLVEEVHEISGHAFPILFLLHVLGALKHALIDKDGVFSRMVKPVSDGR